ncbi:hypothetical protein [Streptomyces malaysiense]|uniref:Asp23/Gls24 family envelope stress response protein n=1 Tax=Streptomyces malaysiense TaxID=1428626 RepID=A0A1J4Q065_9ACTN|nr:hypothetical protein [Streptomyces malaysiense]OIK26409.1 hypothetical protein VT52_016510 [Streptomyces malaysiense]
MTAHTPSAAQAGLVEDVARVVEGVPGVAFLKPGLAARLRSALSRPDAGTGRASIAGVRLTPGPDGTAGRHVDVQVVVVRGVRAVDVARAVRSAVEEHLAVRFPGGPGCRVTVTISGRV